MNTPDLSRATWLKSSYSNGDGGNCVEWAPEFVPAGVVPVRDSKDPSGPALSFAPQAWAEFVGAVAAGRFGEVEPDGVNAAGVCLAALPDWRGECSISCGPWGPRR